MVLCLILAEVVLLGDAEVARKRGQRKMAMSFFTGKADKNSRNGKRRVYSYCVMCYIILFNYILYYIIYDLYDDIIYSMM